MFKNIMNMLIHRCNSTRYAINVMGELFALRKQQTRTAHRRHLQTAVLCAGWSYSSTMAEKDMVQDTWTLTNVGRLSSHSIAIQCMFSLKTHENITPTCLSTNSTGCRRLAQLS